MSLKSELCPIYDDIHLAPILVYDGHPGVARHPLSVGCQDLSSDFFFGVPFPHESVILLILHHAGQQGVITNHLHQGRG